MGLFEIPYSGVNHSRGGEGGCVLQPLGVLKFEVADIYVRPVRYALVAMPFGNAARALLRGVELRPADPGNYVAYSTAGPYGGASGISAYFARCLRAVECARALIVWYGA